MLNDEKNMKKKINIGVVGLGNVGSYFCNEISKKRNDILIKTGKNIYLLIVSFLITTNMDSTLADQW